MKWNSYSLNNCLLKTLVKLPPPTNLLHPAQNEAVPFSPLTPPISYTAAYLMTELHPVRKITITYVLAILKVWNNSKESSFFNCLFIPSTCVRLLWCNEESYYNVHGVCKLKSIFWFIYCFWINQFSLYITITFL